MKTLKEQIFEKLKISSKLAKYVIEVDIDKETIFTKEEIDEILSESHKLPLPIKPMYISNAWYGKEFINKHRRSDNIIYLYYIKDYANTGVYKQYTVVIEKYKPTISTTYLYNFFIHTPLKDFLYDYSHTQNICECFDYFKSIYKTDKLNFINNK